MIPAEPVVLVDSRAMLFVSKDLNSNGKPSYAAIEQNGRAALLYCGVVPEDVLKSELALEDYAHKHCQEIPFYSDKKVRKEDDLVEIRKQEIYTNKDPEAQKHYVFKSINSHSSPETGTMLFSTLTRVSFDEGTLTLGHILLSTDKSGKVEESAQHFEFVKAGERMIKFHQIAKAPRVL